ncbi:MAG: acyltransferase family protein [Pirellulaceae bacterium]|nr:acyltransferase family protein [Pirellulaceae bacterium]
MPSSERLNGFDALRAFVLLLGLVIHAAMPFLEPPVQVWAVIEPVRHVGLILVVMAIHAFRLQVFFLLSGFFAALLIEKRGLRSFVMNRVRRIVVPFIFCVVLVVPLLQLLMVLGYQGRPEAGFMQVGSLIVDVTAYRSSVSDFFLSGAFIWNMTLFHFWFLYYLILLLLIWLFGLGVVSVLRLRPLIMRFAGVVLASRFLILMLVTCSALAMIPMHLWQVDTPFSMIPDRAVLFYYLVFFGVGYSLFAFPARVTHMRIYWRRYLLVSLLVFPLMIFLQTLGPNPQNHPYDHRLELPALWVYSLFSWCMVFGLVGSFASQFAAPRVWVRTISDSAYWQYIAHLPVLLGLQLILIQFHWPILIKLFLQIAITFSFLLVIYRWLIRGSIIGRMLNGVTAEKQT